MRTLKLSFGLIGGIGLLGLGFYVFFNFYSVLFSKNVVGTVFKVERVSAPMALIGGTPAPQVFSFAIAIRDKKSGEIWTASSEDRQWAIVKEGLCVEAELLPYPPWDLTKKGTYHGARLIRLFECEQASPGSSTVPSPPSPSKEEPPTIKPPAESTADKDTKH